MVTERNLKKAFEWRTWTEKLLQNGNIIVPMWLSFPREPAPSANIYCSSKSSFNLNTKPKHFFAT